MEIILIIAVYILGCVLAYGRVRASLFEVNGLYGNKGDLIFTIIIVSMSWIGLATGSLVYWAAEEQTFFKFK